MSILSFPMFSSIRTETDNFSQIYFMRGEIQPTRGVFVRGDEPLM